LGFRTVGEARTAAKKAAKDIAAGNAKSVPLTPEDGHSFLRASEKLKPFGVHIEAAAVDYAEALKILDGRTTVLEAVRCFARTLTVVRHEKTVQQVVDELIQTRQKDGSSVRHIDDLRSRLERFAKTISGKMTDVTASRIQDFLLSLNLAPRTVNNFRTSISNLLSFARMRRYISAETDPLKEVPEAKEPQREVGIYGPEELERMLTHASEEFLPYVVTAAFAGLRQSELERLEWSDVGDKYIRIRGAERRTKSTRLVEIQPNLRAWLKTVGRLQGRVVPFANVCNPLTRLTRKAGVPQKHNGFRHSYGSYRLALVQDAAKVSFEMGNSPKMVFEHYREIVTPEQAKQWFEIVPNEPHEAADGGCRLASSFLPGVAPHKAGGTIGSGQR
jgi:integrase